MRWKSRRPLAPPATPGVQPAAPSIFFDNATVTVPAKALVSSTMSGNCARVEWHSSSLPERGTIEVTWTARTSYAQELRLHIDNYDGYWHTFQGSSPLRLSFPEDVPAPVPNRLGDFFVYVEPVAMGVGALEEATISFALDYAGEAPALSDRAGSCGGGSMPFGSIDALRTASLQG